VSMFNEKYEQFSKTIAEFNLVPKETKKMVVAMSGGKDGAVMAHFILEFQKRERPNIELEMWKVPMPHWEHNPEANMPFKIDERQKALLVEQRKSLNAFKAYWGKRFSWKEIPVQHELYENRILSMHWGCIICFSTRMKAFNDYLRTQPYEDDTLVALGWTKWDAHYTLLSHLLKSDGSKWHEIKKSDPLKHRTDCVFLASFFAYPKVNLGIPGKNIYRINPLIDFDDDDTKALLKELGEPEEIPIIKDICKELFGDVFDQDRRYLSKYLELYSCNQGRLQLPKNTLLYDYRNLLAFMQKSELIPPLEEIDGLVYEAYDNDFGALYAALQK
jgi:hypothetical protein